MFGNQTNGTNDVSVNTRAIIYYSDLSCLQLGYWNNNLSVKMNPLLSSEDGVRKYDFEKRVSTAITQEKAAVLAEAIRQNILPAIEKVSRGEALKEKESVGFGVGKDSAIFVEYDNDEKGRPAVYLSIYKEIQGDKTTDEIYRYKFNKTELVKKYDNKKGSGVEQFEESEFLVFYKLLDNMHEILGTAYHTSEYYNEQSMKRPKGGSSAANKPSNYSAPVEQYSEGGDIPF